MEDDDLSVPSKEREALDTSPAWPKGDHRGNWRRIRHLIRGLHRVLLCALLGLRKAAHEIWVQRARSSLRLRIRSASTPVRTTRVNDSDEQVSSMSGMATLALV